MHKIISCLIVSFFTVQFAYADQCQSDQADIQTAIALYGHIATSNNIYINKLDSAHADKTGGCVAKCSSDQQTGQCSWIDTSIVNWQNDMIFQAQ